MSLFQSLKKSKCTVGLYICHKPTVFILSIAINIAKHVCGATVSIKYNYGLCAIINIMLCLLNSRGRMYVEIYVRTTNQ